jgi:3-hydroxymyristoyl/3-hydroxydecanoyl-(acyl carrier protein) dehydratase
MKKQAPLIIPADHPAFAGHFPGTHIVPGVVLLDEAMHAIAADTGLDAIAWQISSVKFLSPLTPSEMVIIEHEQLANGTIIFEVLAGKFEVRAGKFEAPVGSRHIVTGSLTVRSSAPDSVI